MYVYIEAYVACLYVHHVGLNT